MEWIQIEDEFWWKSLFTNVATGRKRGGVSDRKNDWWQCEGSETNQISNDTPPRYLMREWKGTLYFDSTVSECAIDARILFQLTFLDSSCSRVKFGFGIPSLWRREKVCESKIQATFGNDDLNALTIHLDLSTKRSTTPPTDIPTKSDSKFPRPALCRQ